MNKTWWMLIVASGVGIGVGFWLGHLHDSAHQVENATIRLRQLAVAVELYENEQGLWPPSLETLVFPARGSHREIDSQSPFCIPQLLLDPWGEKIAFRKHGEEFELCSAGPDRHFGTRDDIRTRSQQAYACDGSTRVR